MRSVVEKPIFKAFAIVVACAALVVQVGRRCLFGQPRHQPSLH
jgi:hypothetical protein